MGLFTKQPESEIRFLERERVEGDKKNDKR